MKYWDHDFDLKTSTGRLMHSLRPGAIIITSVALFGGYTLTLIQSKGKNPDNYKDPVFKRLVKLYNRIEPHFFKYLDLIPIYEEK